MAYYILRNDTEYGPYDITAIAQYVDDGKILKHDKAKDVSTGYVNTVGYFLKTNGIKYRIKSKGSFVDQLRGIGSQLILPIGLLKSRQWLSDKRLLLLALIHLCQVDLFVVQYYMLLQVHFFLNIVQRD